MKTKKQKKILLSVLIITLGIIFTANVSFSLYQNKNSNINCYETAEYLEYQNLSEEEKSKYIEPIHYKCEKSNYQSAEENMNTVKASYLDKRYFSGDYNLLSSVKNQGGTGSCWAFAGNSVLETTALNENMDEYDFSERFLEYAITYEAFTDGYNDNGYNRGLNGGSKSPNYFAYTIFRGDAPILEKDMPFSSLPKEDELKPISKASMPMGKSILTVDDYYLKQYNNTYSKEKIDDIKKDVLNYGAVGILINATDSSVKSGKYYYCKNCTQIDHAVVIVGWDDNIKASAFVDTPSVDGAFIVKNSWGSTYGDNGYIYVSYADNIATALTYTFKNVNVNDYDNFYYSSPIANSKLYEESSSYYYEAAKFTKKTNIKEYLDRISFESTGIGTTEIYFSKTSYQDLSNKIATVTGDGNFGVHTIYFDEIEIDSDYYIIIKKNQNSTKVYMDFACKAASVFNDSYYLPIEANKNYYSLDGSNWTDMSTITKSSVKGCEPVIYAYTKNTSKQELSVSIKSINPSNNNINISNNGYYNSTLIQDYVSFYDLYNFKIYNSDMVDKTTDFNINISNLKNNIIKITPKTTAIADNYKFFISYGKIKDYIDFTLYENITSTKYIINNGQILIVPIKGEELNHNNIKKYINFNGKTSKITTSAGVVLSSDTSILPNYNLNVGKINYNLQILGDLSGDGNITSKDYVIIRKHIMEEDLSEIIDDNKLSLLGDISGDGAVTSKDYVLVRMFIMADDGESIN